MAADDPKSAIGNPTGGTSGTGQPDTNPETGTGVAERAGEGAHGLAGGDDSVDAAIGDDADGRTAGTGSGVGRSGRFSSEGTGGSLPNPVDPGDPGGMGGVATNLAAPRGRPPGGVSPIGAEEEGSK